MSWIRGNPSSISKATQAAFSRPYRSGATAWFALVLHPERRVIVHLHFDRADGLIKSIQESGFIEKGFSSCEKKRKCQDREKENVSGFGAATVFFYGRTYAL
jgi:hypothetical protein